jgi:hypothetical protein
MTRSFDTSHAVAAGPLRPESDNWVEMSVTPLCAISDQMQRSKKAPLFDRPVGAGELASAHAR